MIGLRPVRRKLPASRKLQWRVIVGQISDTDIPAHVPRELVRRWALATAPGVELDPYTANGPLLDGPDVFYTPLMKSPSDSGSWVVTRAELIREVFQDPDTFVSKANSGLSLLVGGGWDLIPLEKDPPDHAKYRALLNPLFAPARINEMEAGIRRMAVGLIDSFVAKGECEFMAAFGRPFPVTIFLQLMGLPLEQTTRFLEWEDVILHAPTFEERAVAARAIKAYLLEMMAERRARPLGDLISFAVTAEVDGRKLTDDEVLGICFLLFVAGLDTVASTLGFVFKFLAQSPDHQRLLRAQPELIADAMEEIIRAHAVVNSPRHAGRDVNFHGAPMKKGDRVVLAMTIASRDEREFDRPNEIDFKREDIRHTSFAAGPHRCLGSHLARREIRIAIEEWLARVPPFRIKTGHVPVTHGTTVFGVDQLVLAWN
jgi:cytochrome P450